MTEVSPPVLQLLEWISDRPRSYGETMDAWRSTCPRLTTWEDVLTGGLVQIEADGDETHELRVSLTALGRSLLDNGSHDSKQHKRKMRAQSDLE